VSIGLNMFAGSLPSAIGKWTGITFFNAGTNKFSGSMPSTIGAWTAIQTFYADTNDFSGTLPSAIANWASLKTFDIHKNRFAGTMPTIGSVCALTSQGSAEWKADCNVPAEITCPCCNVCCDASGEGCVKVVYRPPIIIPGPTNPQAIPIVLNP
jgi:hypothetical protein